MSEVVPEGWEPTTLDEIGLFSKGKGISKNQILTKGIPCIRYAEIYTDYDFRIKKFKSFINTETANSSKRLNKGDIIFAGSGETVEDIGKCVSFTLDCEAYVGGDSIILSPSIEVDSDFLSYQINDDSRRDQLRKLGQGSSVIHIYSSSLKELKLLLPPLPEQKKIASILTSVDEVIENTQKQIDKLQDLKKATMNELLTKGIGHTDFKDSELGRIPKSWEVVELKDLFSLSSGKGLSAKDSSALQTQQMRTPVFGGNGINGYTHSPLLHDRSIVIGRVGEYCGCVHMSEGKCWVTDNAIFISNIKETVILDFLFQLLTFFDLSNLRSKGGQPLISQKPIYALKVPIPTLDEQIFIHKTLNSLEHKIRIIKQKLAQTQSLKKSLMQDLLTGKKRVQLN